MENNKYIKKNKELTELLKNKSIFVEDIKDLITIVGESTNNICKITSSVFLYDEEMNGYSDERFFLKFNNYFYNDFVLRLLNKYSKIYPDLFKNMSPKLIGDISIDEKYKIIKRFLGDEYCLDIYFFGLFFNPIKSCEEICYDIILKKR